MVWKQNTPAGPNQKLVVTTHAPPPSSKDYPDSKYVCDEPQDEQGVRPSMNLSRLHKWPTDSRNFRRVVVQEFGHALGMMHEHQNPNTTIPWNREQVYADMAKAPNYWTRQRTDYNYFQLLGSDLASPFDRLSVMLYEVRASWTTDGSSIGYNRDASATDLEWMRRAYP